MRNILSELFEYYMNMWNVKIMVKHYKTNKIDGTRHRQKERPGKEDVVGWCEGKYEKFLLVPRRCADFEQLEKEDRGITAKPGSPGKLLLKWSECVCMCIRNVAIVLECAAVHCG